jgi:acyl carrier protein
MTPRTDEEERTMSDPTHRVTGLLVTKFELDADAVVGEATLEDLEFDSLTLVELATALEKEFGTPIDEEEISGDDTVGDLLRLLEGKMAAPSAG